MLSPAQEDYVEAIWQLGQELGDVRITDIATRLGTRLPTVTRTVRLLERMGYLEHASRGSVRLRPEGEEAARCLIHRHEDVFRLFHEVLGLDEDQAEMDACTTEHGLSPKAAQRLHEFLELLDRDNQLHEILLTRLGDDASRMAHSFKELPHGQGSGWRH